LNVAFTKNSKCMLRMYVCKRNETGKGMNHESSFVYVAVDSLSTINVKVLKHQSNGSRLFTLNCFNFLIYSRIAGREVLRSTVHSVAGYSVSCPSRLYSVLLEVLPSNRFKRLLINSYLCSNHPAALFYTTQSMSSNSVVK
jgi:hypothetical protein